MVNYTIFLKPSNQTGSIAKKSILCPDSHPPKHPKVVIAVITDPAEGAQTSLPLFASVLPMIPGITTTTSLNYSLSSHNALLPSIEEGT